MKTTQRTRLGRISILAGVAAMVATVTVMPPATAADAAAATPALAPAEAFFDPPDMRGLELSPDGKSFAVLVRVTGGLRQLVVGDTSDPRGTLRAVAAYADVDVVGVEWVNNQRLIYTTRKEDQSYGDQYRPGLFAVDKDGTAGRAIVGLSYSKEETGSRIKQRWLSPDHYLMRVLRDGSSDVMLSHYIMRTDYQLGDTVYMKSEGVVPVRIDTRDLTPHDVPLPPELPGKADSWLFDDHGTARMAETQKDGVRKIWMPVPNAPAGAPWQAVYTGNAYGGAEGGFRPLGVGSDGQIYVKAVSGDTLGLYVLNADHRPAAAPVVAVRGFDFEGDLEFDHRKLLGVHYQSDGAGTAWLDPALVAIQAKVDAKLPGLVNRVSPAECGCSTTYAVRSSSDHQPAVYLLYDAATDKVTAVGQEHPRIVARQMSDTDFYRFPARDGMEIPAYVTHPAGKGPWPTVVLVHGGPFQRGAHWEWSAERQFLASRGYLVVEPEFRGSDGYGIRLYEAGFKQWGKAMQDDIADATRWAEAKGWADKSRVCLMGGSYGGYATLMGLARDGDLYRCGVAFAAPTDLIAMNKIWWSDMSNEWRNAGMPAQVGDPVKDAEALRATSPVNLAAKIDRPLLLAHGMLDQRVPIDHAQKMRSALKAAGKPVTWIEYPDEGHGISRPKDRAEYYRRVEAFLAENLAPAK